MNCPCCIMVNGTHDPRCPNGYTFSPVKNGESGVVTTAANVRNVTAKCSRCVELEAALRLVVNEFWEVYEFEDAAPSNPCTNAIKAAAALLRGAK